MQHTGKIQALVALTEKHARFARNSIDRAARDFGGPWSRDFDTLLERLYAHDGTMENALRGYGSFVIDSMRRQKRFESEREYPAKTYEQAAAEVYLNDDYMERQYLPGLLLSHYLWPHHYQQLQYFQDFFVEVLRLQGVGEFAEVGVGTGIYSRKLLEALPGLRGTGYDISPLSLKFTAAHVAAYGFSDRYEVRRQNVITEPPKPVQAVVCVEVLEHLEDPLALIRGLKAMTEPGGRIFLTAALNAANADHIYLYRTPAEVTAQVDAAGLHIENMFFANAYPPEKPGLPVPSALALVLRA